MRPILFLPLSVISLFLPSCGKKAPVAPPPMPPAVVTFLPAAAETVTITRDLPGRIDALRVAEIRARVSGILLKKTFEEGADVKAGDVLFQIDPAPLQAALDSAAANLARAEANAKQAQNQVGRFRELVAVNAVSKQDADNSESAVAIAAAEVLAAKAALVTAELNLSYASVTAPISGRIGKAEVTEGALVGQGSATLLAIIQQLDPIYFDFTQSSSDLIALKKSGAAQSEVTLLLEDGSKYEAAGRMLFSEASVDETTGMVTLRAEFPNPKRDLLPGMFARARVVQSVRENAITIPQRALTRGVGGVGTLMIIDDTNHAQLRMVQTGEMTGDKWVIPSGLKAGERVIIEGLLKARPGAPVVPEPFVVDAKSAPSAASKH
ncbi:efflux RND transporter periplasmic adaptor subunit [bacterium]|nr:efflux RND transporter periplasmic adaptor subunit [bacterium]